MISMFVLKTRSLTHLWIWIFLTIMMNIHSLQAQETQLITINDAIQIALRKNINLGLYANQIATNQVAVNEETANFFPDVSASVSTSKSVIKSGPLNSMNAPPSGEPQMDGQQPDMPALSGQSMDGNSVGFQISSRFSMLNIAQSLASQKSARLEVSSNEANLKRLQQLVTFNVISDYLYVLQYLELIQIEQENSKTQQEQLKQIETFYQAGKRSQADLFSQQADIKQSELDVITAERDLQTSKIQLRETMGERGNVAFKYAALDMDKIISSIENEKPINNLENIRTWYSNRQDFQAQKLRIDAFNENARAARALGLPSISLNFNIGSNYYSSLSNEAFMDQVSRRNLYGQVGLSVSLPIFDRFRAKHNVEKAEIKLSDEHLNLENIKLSIQAEIQQAILDFQTAKKQRESAQAQHIYTQKAMQITKERYAAGAATFVELSEARVKNIRAAYQKISADYNLVRQFAAIHCADGNLDYALEFIP